MIAPATLILKDTFVPRFASIQAILDSVEFLKNYEEIQILAAVGYLLVSALLCSYSVKWDR